MVDDDLDAGQPRLDLRVRRLSADEVEHRAEALVALQRRAYAREAFLIGDDRIPPLHETPAELVAAGLTWWSAEDAAPDASAALTGALATSWDGAVLCIERLVVDPHRARQGVGRQLLVEAVPTTVEVEVSTGRENQPAVRLYLSAGFVQQSDREVLPGLWLTTFRRQAGLRR